MRIVHINIENIRGIEALEIKPGALTVVSGSNGAGKSSVIAAIQAVFEGGHDPSMIRTGAKKGVVDLTLEDGTVIKRTISAKASNLEVTTKDGDKKKSPAAYVAGLASGFALDPIAILTAGKKDRAKFLLENSNVKFQPAELAETIGCVWLEAATLEEVDKLRKGMFEERTGINSRAKESQETAHALRKSMPDEMDRDYVSELAEVESKLMGRTNEASAIKAEGEKQLLEQRTAACDRHAAKVSKLKDALADEQDKLIQHFHASMIEAQKDISSEIADLAEQKFKLRAKADEQLRAALMNEQLELHLGRYRSLDRQADALTKSLEKLDALKAKKLAEDGIEGMEIVDGEIVVGGVPFDALNTAQQYALAFQIAARGVGDLPLMICDRAEAFDSTQWDEFRSIAAESGFQIIAARVSDETLTVEGEAV